MEVIELIGKTLYQWDTGRQVSINPPEGITVDEVHFAGRNDAVALVVAPKTAEEGIVSDDYLRHWLFKEEKPHYCWR